MCVYHIKLISANDLNNACENPIIEKAQFKNATLVEN